MIKLINEDGNSLLKGRKFFLPDGVKKELLSTLKNFNGDKSSVGYKRLNNLLQMNGIKYNEMKRLKNFFDNFHGEKTDIEYMLNGGDVMKSWVNLTLNNATNQIKDFKTAKKNIGINNSFIKPHSKKNNKPKITLAKLNIGKNFSNNVYNNSSLKFENIIKEEYEHRFYDYLTDYDVNYVLNEFSDNMNGKESWTPLINPNMYQKALNEFIKFGHISDFPTKYIYQWFGIIMRNTAKLIANTELAGHTSYFPIDEVSDFITETYSYHTGIDYYVDNDSVKQEVNPYTFFIKDSKKFLTKYDYAELVKKYKEINESNSIHKSGNLKDQYELFMNQDELDDYDKKRNLLNKNEQIKAFDELISFFNSKSNEKLEIIDNKLFLTIDIYYFLDLIGLYDWMQLPDGSDGWSDFGIEPITNLIKEYNDNSTPESVLILINKILDIYHQRGDLSSIFIEGGKKSLSLISNSTYENKKIMIGNDKFILLKEIFIKNNK